MENNNILSNNDDFSPKTEISSTENQISGGDKFNTISLSSAKELSAREQFVELFKNPPIPNNELLGNIGIFANRQTLSRIMFMYELYKKCVHTHGVVMEFGVRWGQNLALFTNFRGMLEPFNHNRKIIGFDTWSGFPTLTNKDLSKSRVGDYAVTENYENYLNQILTYHESENPLSHLKKFELVKGDACLTLKKYLEEHPETIIALAYFDFDIYKPTKECLELIKSHLTKGAVIGFDELNYNEFPGETLALKEVFGLDKFKIQRSPLNPLPSYIIYE